MPRPPGERIGQPRDSYRILVRCLRDALRRTYRHADDRRLVGLTNLQLAGIVQPDDLRLEGGKLVSLHHEDLVEQLAVVQPCPVSGRIEDNEIKLVLGEHGNIWPEVIRADVEAQAA